MKHKDIGWLIRKMRREKELTMVELAKKISIAQPTLSKIENGQQDVSIELLDKICKVFDISLDDFFVRVGMNDDLRKLNFDLPDDYDENNLDERIMRIVASLDNEKKKVLHIFLLSMYKQG